MFIILIIKKKNLFNENILHNIITLKAKMPLKTFLNIKCNAKDNNHVCYNTVGHYIHNIKTVVNQCT